ncbi:hypothetical protein ACLB2K_037917 [Fragaria x ananassa]
MKLAVNHDKSEYETFVDTPPPWTTNQMANVKGSEKDAKKPDRSRSQSKFPRHYHSLRHSTTCDTKEMIATTLTTQAEIIETVTTITRLQCQDSRCSVKASLKTAFPKRYKENLMFMATSDRLFASST